MKQPDIPKLPAFSLWLRHFRALSITGTLMRAESPLAAERAALIRDLFDFSGTRSASRDGELPGATRGVPLPQPNLSAAA